MKSDIVIIGGGASGLMAAYSAAKTLRSCDRCDSVTILEKMPRPGRKIMITGKGRCNFTNVKDWNEFSGHIRSKSNCVKTAFFNLNPEALRAFFDEYGMRSVVERGDRAFPASYRSSDVVDTLVSACLSTGVKIETDFAVSDVRTIPSGFSVEAEDGRSFICSRLIVATGGLSYPGTGSTGDGYAWAASLGHRTVPTFPALTALVPEGYKDTDSLEAAPELRRHVPRETPLAKTGEELCGIQLKNVGARLFVDGMEAESEFGDIDFTDGGIEGPIGFQLSRKAVKALVNGSEASLAIDLKPGISLTDITTRIKELWSEIDKDPRSVRLREKERCRILLGKIIPWDLIPAFTACHPEIITLERRSRTETKVWINLVSIAKAVKDWRFNLAGFVGYERAVITAGGISFDDVVPKTLESRLVPGLYFCGEILDVDCDTGGYNLQTAFSTGALAGRSAAKSI